MNTTIRRFTAVLLMLCVLCAVSVPVLAVSTEDGIQPIASDYIASTSASISQDGGTVTVTFRINATGTMTSVGATKIEIKKPGGTTVKTFYYTTTSGMMAYNRAAYIGSVTYEGSADESYYAKVYFKAANSSGSDTDTCTTGYT